MKKKNWSFILAFVLSFGFGLGSIAYSADPYAKTGGVSDSQLSSKSEGTIFTVTPTAEQTAVIGNTENRICAVFNYKSGVLLSVMDQDRNVTIYDAGKARATLGYNEDGTFTVTNFYLSGSDWKAISATAGSNDTEKLRNFLLATGVDETALNKTAIDSSGNVKNGANTTAFTQEKVEWIDDAVSALKKGVNYSVGINLTSTYGASMTWSVNGKAQETIGYDGSVLEKYNYNSLGTLESITQNTYSVAEGSLTDGVEFEKATNTVYLDAYGRQSYAVDSTGTTVAKYAYSSNGSLVSSYSTESEATTYYSAGKASYSMNDKGFVTAKYDYSTNGSLDGITSYNYDEDTSAVTNTTISAYKWGKAVGSADLSAGTGVQNYDQLRTAVASIKSNANTALNSLESGAGSDGTNSSQYGNITSITVYESDLNNSALMNYLGITAADKTKMLAMSNGYSPVASASFTIDADEPTTTTVDSETGEASTTYVAYDDTETVSTGVTGEKLSSVITVLDRGGASYQFVGTEHTLKETVNAVEEQTVPAVTIATTETPTVTPTEVTTEEPTAIPDKTLDNPAVVSTSSVSDPVVEGTLITVAEIDGETYAVVSAATVDIMDGTGFQAADGETVLVQVDIEMSAKLDKVIEKGITNVIFMGDVIESAIDGFLTMVVNTNYSGGFASGEEVADLKEAIQNEDFAWVKENIAANTAVFGNDSVTVQWKSGWKMLSGVQTVLRERTNASANVAALF